VFAKDSSLKRAGASGFKPLEVNSPMARWKSPQPLEFVEAATKRYSFPNWQSGNDDSIFYNLNITSFFKSRVVPAPDQFSMLERNIQPDLLNLTFNNMDGTTNPTLGEYLVGPPSGSGDDDGPQGQGCLRDLSGHEPYRLPRLDVSREDHGRTAGFNACERGQGGSR